MSVDKIEKLDQEDCGCYVQRKTEYWMGELIITETQILCHDHY